jgi:hypothetical protein
MTSKQKEQTKMMIIGVLGSFLSIALYGVVALLWLADYPVSPAIVSTPLVLLVFDLTVITMFRMSRKKQADDSYIWNSNERRVFTVGCWITALVNVAALIVLLL